MLTLKGSDRVGVQVSDLSLPRRAQLAVVAHIRHKYTEYDELLKEMPWGDARRRVAPNTLEKLAQWRGDKDDEPDTMEEILREVVIISDDEDDDDEEVDDQAMPAVTQALVEQGDAIANALALPQQTRNDFVALRPNYRHDAAPARSERDAYRDARRQERYQVWEQTRGRVRVAEGAGSSRVHAPFRREEVLARPQAQNPFDISRTSREFGTSQDSPRTYIPSARGSHVVYEPRVPQPHKGAREVRNLRLQTGYLLALCSRY